MATGRAARNALAAEAEPTDFVMARAERRNPVPGKAWIASSRCSSQ
jgi:hypothetical protein